MLKYMCTETCKTRVQKHVYNVKVHMYTNTWTKHVQHVYRHVVQKKRV